MGKSVEVGEVDAGFLERLLARIKPVLDPVDYAVIEKIVGSLLGLTRLVRQHGTTIARLRRLVGMSRSEKTADVLGPQRGRGGCGPGGTGPAEPTGSGSAKDDAKRAGKGAESPADQPPDPERRRRGRRPVSAYPDAPHIPVPHESLRPGDACPGCRTGKLYELPDPAHFLRITGQPPLSALCWDCERLRCSPCGAVYTAQAPAEAQGDKYTDSAASMIALLRYRAGMPHHRLEQIQEQLQAPVPASTQWDVVEERAEDVRPAYNELTRQAAQGSILHNDDTRGPILEFMGKRRAALIEKGELPDPQRTGLFTTGVVSVVGEGRKIALFFTGRQHAGENLADLLEQRAADLPPPIQMSDALSWNPPKGHSVVDCNCLAHGRRNFVDEMENHPDEVRYLLERIEQVFKVDDLCRQYRLSDEQRLRLHQRKSGPVMDEIETWMRAQFDEKRIEPNSGLGGAINYLLKRWNKFTLFLRVPGAPLDNNVCERALKAAIRHRNNSLFYRTQHGAEVGDIYMALIYTAELNGENPFDYLTALLRHAKAVAEAPADWLPWNYRATLSRLPEREASGRASGQSQSPRPQPKPDRRPVPTTATAASAASA